MQRSNKQTRGRNAVEAAFQGWLKMQDCCVSGEYGVQVHHCEGSAFKHNKVLIGHWFCIPLSVGKHKEYHSGTKAFRGNYGPQSLFWIVLHDLYVDDGNDPAPDDVIDSIMDWGR